MAILILFLFILFLKAIKRQKSKRCDVISCYLAVEINATGLLNGLVQFLAKKALKPHCMLPVQHQTEDRHSM